MADTTIASHGDTAAKTIHGVLQRMLGAPLPVRIIDWHDNEHGDPAWPSVRLRERRALTRIVHAPGEIGLARAFVTGELDTEGDVFGVLDLVLPLVRDADPASAVSKRELFGIARRLGVLAPEPPPPATELPRPRSVAHSIHRDRQSVSHHYDVGNAFYRLFLGPSMTYSCGYWRTRDIGLDAAQRDKAELVCRKLGLRPGMRMLDVGSGWGTLLIHAALHHGVTGVGVTLSTEQRAWAERAAAEAGVGDRVEFRLQDYRHIDDGPFDAISSIGMAEHVGGRNLPTYADALHALLRPGGRLLNHAIASTFPVAQQSSLRDRRSFIDRYVFPDGELVTMATMNAVLERAGFEVRDVESLREHYALTLRAWVHNLRASWDHAVELVGEERARVWWLYMAGSAVAFENGSISIFQTLAVKQEQGSAGVPLTRGELVGDLLHP